MNRIQKVLVGGLTGIILCGGSIALASEVDPIVIEVVEGYWGNGAEREVALFAAGYDYNEVQNAVNEYLNPILIYEESTTSNTEYAAKEWIAFKESSGSYEAYNPTSGCYGRYQLNPTLIHYGASPAEQEAAADAYVAERYGSWSAAKVFWEANGWY